MPRLVFTPIDIDAAIPDTTMPATGTVAVPEVPRNFIPKPEDRYMSYVLEIKADDPTPQIAKLQKSLNRVFSGTLSGYFPELLFAKKEIWQIHSNWIKNKRLGTELYLDKAEVAKLLDDIKQKKYPSPPFKLEQLFPGSEADFKHAKKFGLHKFLLLTLPIFQRQFERKTSKNRFNAVMHEISYKLRDELKLVSSYPSTQFKGYKTLSSGSPQNAVNTLPRNWHLTNTFSLANQLPAGVNGQGVVIGHPDSGWTPHKELNFVNVDTNPTSPNFDLTRDWNVLNDRNTAEESLSSIAFHHFHGTATASLIISSGDNNLTGIAPRATILPIRCVAGIDTGVVLIGDTDVARAVWYATQKNVDVISMSIGGYPSPVLECVVAHAVYNNLIVVAAAGNYYPLVIFPARYPECIAVGASNAQNSPWAYTARGNKVAFSAPGEDVYCAEWDDSSPNRRAIVEISGPDGTSFSTAITAGAAALWLQRYGKRNLINGLNGRATLQELFLAHVQSTVTITTRGGWNTSLNGAGILNVQNLLDPTTLPNLATFSGRNWNNWARRTAMELLFDMYENTDPVIVRERLQNLVNTSDPVAFMEQFGQEVLNMLVAIPDAFDKLGDAMNESASAAGDTIEEVVEAVEDFVSDPIGTIAGWF